MSLQNFGYQPNTENVRRVRSDLAIVKNEGTVTGERASRGIENLTIVDYTETVSGKSYISFGRETNADGETGKSDQKLSVEFIDPGDPDDPDNERDPRAWVKDEQSTIRWYTPWR